MLHLHRPYSTLPGQRQKVIRYINEQCEQEDDFNMLYHRRAYFFSPEPIGLPGLTVTHPLTPSMTDEPTQLGGPLALHIVTGTERNKQATITNDYLTTSSIYANAYVGIFYKTGVGSPGENTVQYVCTVHWPGAKEHQYHDGTGPAASANLLNQSAARSGDLVSGSSVLRRQTISHLHLCRSSQRACAAVVN